MAKKQPLKTEIVKLSEIKKNPNNPRIIKDDKFKKLVDSIRQFPEMLQLRPIVVNDDMIVLGGNMRLKACKEVGLKDVPIIKASTLTEEQQREFIVKDNIGYGEWDWTELEQEWNIEQLEDWGLDIELKTETEKLSELKFESIYYEPKETPNIDLKDCVDLKKFNAKINAINELNLSNEQKEVLRFFTYRFIKIDFESVANYYAFNASEEEQKAIERLRLVLVDGSIDGFVEDDLLKVMQTIIDWEDDD